MKLLLKMAQKAMDDRMYKLSDTLAVVVTDNGQVQFTITPGMKLMRPSVVTISGKAWESLEGKAINKVNQCIQEQEEEEWEYHPKTKFVKVSKAFNGWRVNLKTYTLRGTEMKEHNVSLNQEEWDKLVEVSLHISNDLARLKADFGAKNRECITMFQPRFDRSTGVRSPEWYFSKETAEERAEDICQELTPDSRHFEIVSRLTRKPDEKEFMRKLYLVLIYRVGCLINNWYCGGCVVGGRRGYVGGSHVDKHGCQYRERKIFSDYFEKIHRVLDDRFVLPVWEKCWDLMKLPERQGSKELLKEVKGIWANKVGLVRLVEEVIRPKIDVLPEALLADVACDFEDFDLDMTDMMDDKFDSDESDTDEEEEEEDKPYTVKKRPAPADGDTKGSPEKKQKMSPQE